MLKFNTLLDVSGLNPAAVRLARHKDNKLNVSLWELWKTDRSKFEDYQCLQAPNKFADSEYLASFIVNALNETVFTGMYRINGSNPAPAGYSFQIGGHEISAPGDHIYDLEPTDHLHELSGLIVIEWGEGALARVQKANNQNKDILEIRRTISEPDFPGFFEFTTHFDKLRNLPASWITALKAVHGIYLLVNLDTGQQYIGSATGDGGLWGRWSSYVATGGHGNNIEMMELGSSNYQFTVLEVVHPNALHSVERLETIWKDKLLTRRFGLNAN